MKYTDPDGRRDRDFRSSKDFDIKVEPNTETPRYIIKNGSKVLNTEVYNCHSDTFNNGNGDPQDPANKNLIAKGILKWDDSAENNLNELLENGGKRLSDDDSNKVGDIIIYYADDNKNGQWDKGEYIGHSATVSEVDDAGFATKVTGKDGYGGRKTSHPRAIYQSGTSLSNPNKVYHFSREYFRKNNEAEK